MEAVTGADLSFVNLGITIEHLPNSITVFGFRIAFYEEGERAFPSALYARKIRR